VLNNIFLLGGGGFWLFRTLLLVLRVCRAMSHVHVVVVIGGWMNKQMTVQIYTIYTICNNMYVQNVDTTPTITIDNREHRIN